MRLLSTLATSGSRNYPIIYLATEPTTKEPTSEPFTTVSRPYFRRGVRQSMRLCRVPCGPSRSQAGTSTPRTSSVQMRIPLGPSLISANGLPPSPRREVFRWLGHCVGTCWANTGEESGGGPEKLDWLRTIVRLLKDLGQLVRHPVVAGEKPALGLVHWTSEPGGDTKSVVGWAQPCVALECGDVGFGDEDMATV